MRKQITRIAGLHQKRTISVLNEIDSRLSSIKAMAHRNIDDLMPLGRESGSVIDKKILAEIGSLMARHGDLCRLLDTFDK